MRIDPKTLLFHELTPDEAQILQTFGEEIVFRGKYDKPPQLVQEWFLEGVRSGAFGDDAPQRLIAFATVLPARIFYSLLIRAQWEATLSPVTRRRLDDGRQAMEALEPPPDASESALLAYLNTVKDGIRALQSLDDLGPEMNQKCSDDMEELFERLDRHKGRVLNPRP